MTLSEKIRTFLVAERKEGRSSFLKKRSKKLLSLAIRFGPSALTTRLP